MAETEPKYRDLRAAFWRRWFGAGLAYEPYVATGEARHQERWHEVYGRAVLTEAQRTTVAGFVRPLNVLVLSGVWCGDCIRQGPYLARIAEANERITVRFVDNRANPELQDELRINGAMKIPVAVFLWAPEVIVYRGLSGIDSALFTLALVGLLREAWVDRSRGHVLLLAAVGLGFLLKVALEIATGTAVFADSTAFHPVPLAHMVGACTGLCCAALRRPREATGAVTACR